MNKPDRDTPGRVLILALIVMAAVAVGKVIGKIFK